MNIWETLGIEATSDIKVIRKRYAELVRLYHPEDQPEIYQQIVEAYKEALTFAKSRKIRSQNSHRKISTIQEEILINKEKPETYKVTLDFDSFNDTLKNDIEESKKTSLNFSDYNESTHPFKNTLNIENVQSDYKKTKLALDFSAFNETNYLIQNAIESIIGNKSYTFEEQECLWFQLFHDFKYDLFTLKSVLEEMDVFIFERPEQLSLIKFLVEEYIPDFLYWPYYYRLKYWRVKRATVKDQDILFEDALSKKEKFYASYRLCQAILDNLQKANQIKTWVDFFKEPFSTSTLLWQLNDRHQIFENVLVLRYILEKIRPALSESDYESYDMLVTHLEVLEKDSSKTTNIYQYSLDNPDEVEVAFYQLIYSCNQDDSILLEDLTYFFKKVKNTSLILGFLKKVDVYSLINRKALSIILQNVDYHSGTDSNECLKKLEIWSRVQSYSSIAKECDLNNKERFEHWYEEVYLFVENVTTSDELINNWNIWKTYLNKKNYILEILFEQIYKAYHRFTDGKVLREVLKTFPSSKMAPHMMTEETDQKLEEMLVYSFEINRPKSQLSYSSWKKRQFIINKILQFVFAIFTFFCLIQSIHDQPGSNIWVNAGTVSLFCFYLISLKQIPIDEGVSTYGVTSPPLLNLNMWGIGTLLFVLAIPSSPVGTLATLSFITFFSLIDGFKINQGIVWTYSLNKLIPIGICFSSGFLVALAIRSSLISELVMKYVFFLIIALGLLTFTKYSPGFSPLLKKIFFSSMIGIIVFQLFPLTYSRLKLFNPLTLGHETLFLTVIILINAIALSYFRKEQSLIIGVKKVFIIYGLQLFIFLRRLLRILFAPISPYSKVDFDKDLLIINTEYIFFFLEVLFILMMFFLIHNILKERKAS